jgi:hypothetical protein
MMRIPKRMARASLSLSLVGCAPLGLGAKAALAQQVTGTPGSRSATATAEGNQLPPPPQK